MHHVRRLRRTPALALCIAALVMAVGGIAYAAIPDASGVIHSCYRTASGGAQPQGSLRVIDTGKGQTCRPSETALSFNKVGQRGATGPAGPAGATGPAGPAGVTNAWWSSQLNLLDIPGGGTSQLSMFNSDLDPGSYLLNVTAALSSFTLGQQGEIDCLVNGADEQVIQLVTNSGVVDEPSLGQLTVTAAENPQISCTNHTGGDVDVQVYASATQVANLH